MYLSGICICGFSDTSFVYSVIGTCVEFTFVFAELDTSNWVVHTRNSSSPAHTSGGKAEPWALQLPKAAEHVPQCSLLQLWPASFHHHFVHTPHHSRPYLLRPYWISSGSKQVHSCWLYGWNLLNQFVYILSTLVDDPSWSRGKTHTHWSAWGNSTAVNAYES